MAERRSLDGKAKTLRDFSAAVEEALNEIAGATYEQIDRGLDKAMDYMRDKLAAASPEKSGLTRESWEGEDKYKNVRYINNTATRPKTPGDGITSGDGEIPIVNLLEFGKKGHPFVRKTVQAEQAKAIEIIKEEIRNG